MHETHSQMSLVKQMMRERQRDAEIEAMRPRHSRSGLMGSFLRRLADRVDPTGEGRREL
ncbi:MAG TPA: hypothetical protein VFL29_09895 [Candidatus Dormibacteraeota bacterium]|nr:hypothetical protein [Candidatus Dormibacteraeota bacterium]